MTPVEEKLVQHRLRWFRHMQRRSADAPIRNVVIRRTGNKKSGRGRPNLTWEEFVKRDLKDWCITNELALDRRVEASNSCVRTLIFGFLLLLPFVKFFSLPLFHFFDLAFYCLFSFFIWFFIALYFPLFFALVFAPVVSSLASPNLLGNKRLGCCCCYKYYAFVA
jgi:hypothetical protein